MSKTIQSCLSSDVLEQIERNDVSPDELIAIEEHVSECPRCRELFDSHYTSSQWSELIQPALSDAQLALTSVTEDGADHSAAILKLLGPTDDPNMLGRIGNYEIVGVIGQGGMGAVFKGFDRSLNRFVAIKMLLPHLAASGAARKRFAREGQAVAAVVDDHVMAIHCVDQWQGIPYLVMTYSRGVSLQKRLNDSGPLELREILRIGMQAAKGLAAAHAQGIVHRDIKPSNILLDQNVERVQLVDFGLARAVDDASLTCSGTLAGTPQYMSPEQARAETVDHRSDLFSLGSVLYAMCAGYAPFRADSSYSVLRLIIEKEPRSIREINSDIPDWLCAIIGKLMAKQAVDRFDSAKQVAELLEACLAHVQQPTTVPLPSNVTELVSLGSSTSGSSQTQAVPNADLRKKTWHRFVGPPIGKYLAAALAAAAMILAGVVIVLELDKGTLTIKSVADDVPIRIVQGKDTVQALTVSKQGTTTRLRAGTYTVEIEADSTAYEIQGDSVTVKRGENALVNISISQATSVKTPPAVDASQAKVASTDVNVELLLSNLDFLNSREDRGFNAQRSVRWGHILMELTKIGSTAVPKIIERLDQTEDDRTIASLAFVLRAIGDKRAVPALIRTIPKTLGPSKYGNWIQSPSDDRELIEFFRKHRHEGQGDALGCSTSVSELSMALASLTDVNLATFLTYGSGTERQVYLQRKLLYNEAKRWADWWEQNSSRFVDDVEFAKVKLAPFTMTEPDAVDPNQLLDRLPWLTSIELPTLQSANTSSNGEYSITFLDLDTGRSEPIPQTWRDKQLSESDRVELLAWAEKEGFDLFCDQIDGGHYVLRGLGLRSWQIDDKWWTDGFESTSWSEMARNGRAVTDDRLIPYVKDRDDRDPVAMGLFLIVTREGTPGHIYVGTQVTGEAEQFDLTADWLSDKKGYVKGRKLGLRFFKSNESLKAQGSPTTKPSNEHLVNGIQWSTYGANDGLLSGARLILGTSVSLVPVDGGVYPGQPVAVEYRLKNVSTETKKLIVYIRGNRDHIAIGKDNRITDSGITTADGPTEITIEPGKEYVATSHRASIETHGLAPGVYQVALGSAFFYPDKADPSSKHEIPHRGSISFEILQPDATISRPLSQDIHWGQSVSGLRLGAKFRSNSNNFAIGSIVEADLWIANVTKQVIECSILLPHPMDGWLFNIENHLGSTIMLERPPRISIFHPQEFFAVNLAPGEVRQITGEPIEGQPDKFAGRSAKFEIVNTKENQGWGDHTIKGRLVTEGGDYSAIFDVTLQRPDIPKMRIELDSGNCPFTVGNPGSDPMAAQVLKEAIITWNDPLTFAIDRFNKRMRDTHPGNYPYNQPPLTKDELIAYASWNMERGDKLPAKCKAGLTKIAKQHRLPENWTIDGFYGETSNGGEPVLAFQIFLQTDDNPATQMVIRRRFLSPPKDYSLSTATNDQGSTSLAAAVKRFNARHSQAAGIEQPPLTEDEVVAAVLYTKARRDDHDVSDALFERFQNIARTRQLPEGATLEVIPTFGVEGGSTYTIWSIRLTMLQDEPDRKGWTYGFLLREQFVSVKHGDAGSIHWGKPAENGLQAGVRLSPPLKSYQLGQKISVEILFRNILTKPISASVPNFPSYEVEACDKEEGAKLDIAIPQLQIVGGWRSETIGDQPLSLRGWPIVLLPSTTSFEERAKMRLQDDDQVVIFVDPGKSCRVRLTVSNYENDAKGTLTTGEVDFAVDTLDSKGVTINSNEETVAGSDDPLALAIDRFNERMLSKFLFHNQPPLTKDELVACATWYMERDDSLSKARKDSITKIAKQKIMPDGWTIEGEYSDLPPVLDPVVAFQIYLQTDSLNERFMIRRRFLWPSKDQSPSPATTDQVGGTSLAIAVKQFNARHSHFGGQQQPRLTVNEVVAAILHNQTVRDMYAAIGVSDELFNRFQNIARTRLLPEGATLELIPTPVVEGGSTFTIWSIGIAMLGDKGHEGRTTTFEIRRQFVSVKQGDKESKDTSSTKTKGKAERVINGWPVPDTLEKPSFPKELHGKWRIQNATTLTTKKTEYIDQVAVIDQNTVLLPSGDQGTLYRLSHWKSRDDNQSIEVDLTMESTDEKDSKTYRCLLEINGDELILLRQQNERFSRPKSVDDISTSITRFTLTREQTENNPMVYSPLEAIEVAKRFANVDHGKSIGVKFRVESVHPPFVPSEEDEFGHTKTELHLDFRPLPANFKDDQFLVVLTPEAISQLNKLGISDIEKHFLHKEVEAHGRVLSTMYTARGMPGEHFHLIVSELRQIAFSKVQPAPENTLPNRCNVEIVEFDRLKLSQLGIELDPGDVDSQGSPISLENVESFRAITGSLEEKGLAVKILSVSKRIASEQSSTMTEKIDPREFNLSLLPHIKPDGYTADLELRVTQPDLTRPEKTRTRSVEFDCEGKLDETIAMDVTKLFTDDSKSKLVILLLTIEL